MAIRFVKKELNDRTGVVIIEADTQEEVLSAPAKQLAIKEASASITRPGIGGNDSAYPVDANGETSQDLVMGQGVVAAYRCDYHHTGGL